LKKIVIIGAGLTGLSVAYHLGRVKEKNLLTYQVFEKYNRPGGLCRTEEEKGFLFDYTGHLLHCKTSYFEGFLKELLGSNLLRIRRSAWIYSNDVYTRYPFQANLYGRLATLIVSLTGSWRTLGKELLGIL
jgi:protoporphyrinogen oxidase